MGNKTEIRHRFALLIGVRDYVDTTFRKLPQTVNDVTELEKILNKFDYTVSTLHCDRPEPDKKPTRANIWAELKNIADLTERGDLLLVHFGGHGDLDRERSPYLVPSDGRRSALRESAIDLEKFKQQIVEAGAQARILILDACHSGIGRDAAGMSTEFEHHVFLEAFGTATLAACRRHETAYNHDTSPHGVFTYYLLEGLNGAAARKSQRFITFDDLKNYVTHAVKSWAFLRGRRQWPNADTQLVGDPALVDLDSQPGNAVVESGPPKIFPPNPFTEMLAIRDPNRFIGRQAENRRLKAYLHGGSVALLGDPRIGKSSLLWHLARTWGGKIIGPLNIDELENRSGFYNYIANALGLDNTNWDTIYRALESSKVLFLMDELDVSPIRGLEHSDFTHFRALCENNRDFKIAAVSRTPLKDIFPDTGIGSPFFNILQPFTLGLLDRNDALRLLDHPWDPGAPGFDSATREQLLTAAGHHPFKLQRAAFHCYQSLMDPSYHWSTAFKEDVRHML